MASVSSATQPSPSSLMASKSPILGSAESAMARSTNSIKPVSYTHLLYSDKQFDDHNAFVVTNVDREAFIGKVKELIKKY